MSKDLEEIDKKPGLVEGIGTLEILFSGGKRSDRWRYRACWEPRADSPNHIAWFQEDSLGGSSEEEHEQMYG